MESLRFLSSLKSRKLLGVFEPLVLRPLKAPGLDGASSPPLLVALPAPAQPHLLFPLGGHFQGLVLVGHSLVGLLGQVGPLSVQVRQVLGGPGGLLVHGAAAEGLALRSAGLHRRGLLVGGVHLLQQLVQPQASLELLQGAAFVVHQLGMAHRPLPARTLGGKVMVKNVCAKMFKRHEKKSSCVTIPQEPIMFCNYNPIQFNKSLE